MKTTNRGTAAESKTKMMYRQGDVGIRLVNAIPSNTAEIARDNGRIILAYGEVTGHAHAILDTAAELVRTADTNQRFLRVMGASGVELRHEEHATIILPPGNYEIIQQVEYVPQALPRAVAD